MIGQPPRIKGGEYDKHELSVWFEQIYRDRKTTVTPPDTGGGGDSGGGSDTGGGGSVTINNYDSKRFLRWFGI